MDFDLYDDVLLGENHSEKDEALKLENETLRVSSFNMYKEFKFIVKLKKSWVHYFTEFYFQGKK